LTPERALDPRLLYYRKITKEEAKEVKEKECLVLFTKGATDPEYYFSFDSSDELERLGIVTS
jgi:hypothetical protein